MAKNDTDVVEPSTKETKPYEKPEIKTLNQRDVVRAVSKGAKFPARGFAG